MPKLVRKKTSLQEKYVGTAEFARLGGLKGGPARSAALTPKKRSAIARKGAEALAAKLSPEERSASARKAVLARWAKTRRTES